MDRGPWRCRSRDPSTADLVGDVLRDQRGGPVVHGAIAGGIDDQVGRQLLAIAQDALVAVSRLISTPVFSLISPSAIRSDAPTSM